MADAASHKLDPQVGGKYRLGKRFFWCVLGSHYNVDHPQPPFITGDIYLGINIISGEEVAIKLKSVKASSARV